MTAGVFAASTVKLIGEEEITDVQVYASRLLEEAAVFFDPAPSDWDFVGAYDHGLQVFSRPVEGSKVSFIFICKRSNLCDRSHLLYRAFQTLVVICQSSAPHINIYGVGSKFEH